MRTVITKLTLAFFLLNSLIVHATDYYFSASGNDNNAGTESSPFQSLNKINSLSLKAGDRLLFRRGDMFAGTFTVTTNGTSSSPISFDAYGNGNKPILTGLSDATGWTSIGNNLWESSALSNGGSSAMIVLINGVSVPMGKWPNGYRADPCGWRVYNSANSSSLTDKGDAGSCRSPNMQNFVGGTLVIRKDQYTIQKGTITSQSGTGTGATFNYTPFSDQNVERYNSGYGYFIQNHINTLDAQNEWYYNATTKKLDVYSNTAPTNVKIATITTIADLSNRSYITLNNLVFQGANLDLITANGGSNIAVLGCDLQFAGNTAFWANKIDNLIFQNCTVSDNNNMGIFIAAVNSTGNVISNNTIRNTGVYAGMQTQDSHTIVESCNSVLAFGGLTFKNNTIINSGYSAIQFKGSNVLIQNNYIDSTCITKDEGSSIYSYVGAADNTAYTNQVIDANIIINAVGALAGKPSTKGDAKAIYMDINVRNVNITNNSIANCANFGICMQDNQNDLVTGNTIYNCGNAAIAMWSDALGVIPLNSITLRRNVLVTHTPNQGFGTAYYQTIGNSYTDFGTSDSNIIATPVNDVNAWYTASAGPTYNHFTLSDWKSRTGHDQNSRQSPKTTSNASDLRFEYNETTSPKDISLGNATYMDMLGKTYSGKITLQPYTSVILIYEGQATVFYNSPMSQTFTRNNCPAGTIPSSVVYSVPAGKYSSTVSQADADAQAQADINANGQNYANQNGTCGNLSAYSSNGFTKTFTKNNCTSGAGSSVTYSVPAGKYVSVISQADADNKALADIEENGQKYANAVGQCNLDQQQAAASQQSSRNRNEIGVVGQAEKTSEYNNQFSDGSRKTSHHNWSYGVGITYERIFSSRSSLNVQLKYRRALSELFIPGAIPGDTSHYLIDENFITVPILYKLSGFISLAIGPTLDYFVTWKDQEKYGATKLQNYDQYFDQTVSLGLQASISKKIIIGNLVIEPSIYYNKIITVKRNYYGAAVELKYKF